MSIHRPWFDVGFQSLAYLRFLAFLDGGNLLCDLPNSLRRLRVKRQVRLRERRRSRRVELLPLEELYCALVLFSSRTAAEGAEIPAATCLRILFP